MIDNFEFNLIIFDVLARIKMNLLSASEQLNLITVMIEF